MLARALKIKLEILLPPAYDKLAGLASKYRDAVKQHIQFDERRGFWERVFVIA